MNDENLQKSRKTNLKILNKNIVEKIYGPIAAPYLADNMIKYLEYIGIKILII